MSSVKRHPKKVLYSFTTPQGFEAVRRTDRVYTHVLVVETIGSDRGGVVSWHSSAELAESAMRQHRKWWPAGRVDGRVFAVVPVPQPEV